MLRRATRDDEAALLGYLRVEPEFNLFIIGDILSFGFDSDACDIFVQERDGAHEAVLMRYREALVLYTHDPSLDLTPCIERMNALLDDDTARNLLGKQAVVDAVRPRLTRAVTQDHLQYFCVCRAIAPDAPAAALDHARMAEPRDGSDVGAMLSTIPGMARSSEWRDRLGEEIAEGKTVVSLVRDADSGEVVSTAAWVAETDGAAMIIGVGTREAHQRKGYASACVRMLAEALHARGKAACLFFHNPAAGAIYHRLGFEDMGMWKMLRFHEQATSD